MRERTLATTTFMHTLKSRQCAHPLWISARCRGSLWSPDRKTFLACKHRFSLYPSSKHDLL